VELHPDLRGKDLGLRLIHETLVFLKGEWSLAVMVPGSLGSHIRRWNTNDPDSAGGDSNRRDPWEEPTPEQLEKIDAKTLKVQRHFARMGFVQAGRSRRCHDSFF